MGVWYASREDVKNALGTTTNISDSKIDRALESASRAVEGKLNRRFYPWTGTRYFDWPNDNYARSWRLWVDGDQGEPISLTSFVSGGTTISAANYNLRRPDGVDEPPYEYLEVSLSSSASLSSSTTHQRSQALTGVFGYDLSSVPVGTVSEVLDASETGVDIADSSLVGVGDLLTVDSERMLVSAKSWITSGQTVQTPLTANNNNTTVAVTDGTTFHAGEVILVDAEKMRITDVVVNNLIVTRAYDGTVLATHTGSTIYASRTLTVTRGVLGTTAATHLINATVTKQVYPGPVSALTIAYAINNVLQESSGYARVAGSGDNQQEFTGRGIAALERDALQAVGRQGRTGAV
jgi:hypothetical protein